MTRTQFTLTLAIVFLPASVNAGEGHEERPPTVQWQLDWDRHAGTLSAHIEDAPIEEVTDALEREGIGVELHDSWRAARLSAEFEDLALDQAVQRLFGKGFILLWTADAVAAAADPEAGHSGQPVIRLLAMGEYPPPSTQAEKPPEDTTARDAATLEALVESGTEDAILPALESALTDGSEALRAVALDLVEDQYILTMDNGVLRSVAHNDTDPALRRQALQIMAKRSHEPDAAWSALTHSVQNDSDANVREYARAALSELSMRAAWLYNRDLHLQPGGDEP